MKKVLLSLVCISIFACQEKEPEPTFAIVSGTLENLGSTTVNIYDPLDEQTPIEISDNGTFLDSIALDQPGYYKLRIGRTSYNMYLEPGQDIAITADIANKTAKPQFAGTAAAASTYLVMQSELTKAVSSNYGQFFGKEENAFSTTLDSLKQAQLSLIKSSNLPEELVALETKAIEYQRLENKMSYAQAHSYYAKKEEYTPSESFEAELKAVNLDNEEDAATIPSYRNLAFTELNNRINEMYDPANPLTLAMIIDVIKETKSPTLRNEFAKNYLFFMSPSEDTFEQSYKDFLALANTESVQKRINEKYEVLKNLVKGKPSPSFNYENFKGGNTALSDLKGKYVYIDVWATWCGPCIGEIPSLQAMEGKFHDSNIEFVSISIDEKQAYDKWRTMITDKSLGGEQLMADNAWQSKFVKDYGIQGIPRFILLDPEGNIVSADAPRPSNPNLEATFNELGL